MGFIITLSLKNGLWVDKCCTTSTKQADISLLLFYLSAMESPPPDKPITLLSGSICAFMMPIDLLLLGLEAVLFQCAVQKITPPQKYNFKRKLLLSNNRPSWKVNSKHTSYCICKHSTKLFRHSVQRLLMYEK